MPPPTAFLHPIPTKICSIRTRSTSSKPTFRRLSTPLRPRCTLDPPPPSSTSPPPPPAPVSRSTRPPYVPPPRRQEDSKLTFWFAAVVELLAALIAIFLCSITDLPPLGRGFAITPPTIAHACLTAIPFSLLFWLLERAPTGIQAATEQSFRAFFQKRRKWEVGVFCLCVAFGEELLFRGWLLAGLEQWGSVPAVIGSGLVFGALHAYTRVYMILASLAGLLFGGMFVWSGENLLEPLVVHFLYDFVTILAMQAKWLAGDEE